MDDMYDAEYYADALYGDIEEYFGKKDCAEFLKLLKELENRRIEK